MQDFTQRNKFHICEMYFSDSPTFLGISILISPDIAMQYISFQQYSIFIVAVIFIDGENLGNVRKLLAFY
jgi:hypothetical protein